MTFDDAFEALMAHEGGYVNDPHDPGGETKYGISKRAYPAVDIGGLTLEAAKAIYRRDYWRPAGCESVPEAVRFDLFDMAVNSGIRPAIKTLQRAVGAGEDGVLGPVSLAAIEGLAPAALMARFNGARLAMLTELATWPRFGKGWARRIAANLMKA
jgi:lysozyme family protein